MDGGGFDHWAECFEEVNFDLVKSLSGKSGLVTANNTICISLNSINSVLPTTFIVGLKGTKDQVPHFCRVLNSWSIA